jgi:shikimate kinase
MAVIGTGQAHGACSLLHAAGTGYGASLSLDLPVIVKALDKPSKRELNDSDNLLKSVVETWVGNNLSLPEGLEMQDIHWAVASKIPQNRGLKSSAAVSIAAIKALCEATSTELEDAEIVSLSSQSQINAGVSITGSIDDSWACLTKGWKLIDANAEDITSGVIMEGPGPNSDDWIVLIVIRDARTSRPQLEDFVPMYQEFEKALIALQQGEVFNCLTMNGRAVCSVTNDIQGRKISNDAFINGARASGLSGSGPAVVIVIPSILKNSVERLKSVIERMVPKEQIIETKFLSLDSDELEME